MSDKFCWSLLFFVHGVHVKENTLLASAFGCRFSQHKVASLSSAIYFENCINYFPCISILWVKYTICGTGLLFIHILNISLSPSLRWLKLYFCYSSFTGLLSSTSLFRWTYIILDYFISYLSPVKPAVNSTDRCVKNSA